MKKCLSIFIAVFLIVSAFPLMAASAESYTEGNYTYSVEDGCATILGYSSTDFDGKLNIPSTLGGYPVTVIGADAFTSLTDEITEFSLPESLKVITSGAFNYCRFSAPFKLPGSSVQVQEGTFNYCTFNGPVTISEDLTRVMSYTFSNCTFNSSVIIPDNITIIDESAFAYCSFTEPIVIPGSAEELRGAAFERSQFNGGLTIEEGVKIIMESAFSGCYFSSSLTIPKSVTEIGYGAFESTSFGSDSRITFLPNECTISSCAFNMAGASQFEFNLTDFFLGSDWFGDSSVNILLTDNVKNLYLSSSYSTGMTTIYVSANTNLYGSMDALRYNSNSVYLNIMKYSAADNAITGWIADATLRGESTDFTNVNYLPTDTDITIEEDGDGKTVLSLNKEVDLPKNMKVGTKFITGWTLNGAPYSGKYTEGAVAEYIETKMLDVKVQVSAGATSSDEYVDCRFIASVDGLERYREVGWLFSRYNSQPTLEDVGSSDNMKRASQRSSTVVYRTIRASGKQMSAYDIYGKEYSKYLTAFEIRNIPQIETTSPITARAYAITEDGTVVYGEARAVTVRDYLDLD